MNIMKHDSLETDTKKAITESFMTMQDELKAHVERLSQPTTAGSTGTVIMFKGKKMYVAWVGDSLAAMFTTKKDIELVEPHKPSTEVSSKVQKRIEFIF
jgi:protein phosphatase 1E